jgi:hypothetical protein
LDTAMIVLSGVGLHYTGYRLKILIPVISIKKDLTSAWSTTWKGHRVAKVYLQGLQGKMFIVCHFI